MTVRKDQSLKAKEYFTSEMWLDWRDRAARHIQKMMRGYFARKLTKRLKEEKRKRMKEQIEREEEYRRKEEEKHEREIKRRIHPRVSKSSTY